ncbi:MAG: enoyl-CoA hydratase/isomerase family protein [Bacteroidetes bacterium]|nr:enoyl-CoA hydratase/isomerase family protein [Bacteroidota bacterium]
MECIIVQRDEGVGIITLNRPQVLNALNLTLNEEMERALCDFESDEDIKVVIVTGAGDKAFSAGADIHEAVDAPPDVLERRNAASGQLSWHIATYPKPVIGAINGLAYGGAALMSSLFDIRIGCERTKFRYLAASYGRVNSTWSLPTQIGLPKAKELMFTGRVVEVAEAKEIGLLNQVVPSDQLMSAAMEMAKLIAKNTPQMVQGIKKLVNDGVGRTWRERYDMEAEARDTWLRPLSPGESFADFLARKGHKPQQ